MHLGIDVYRPLNDGTRCDLIFDLAGKLMRVQVKWAHLSGDVLIIRCYRCRRTKAGLLTRSYTANEVDAFAAYSMDLDKCFFLPFEVMQGRNTVQLPLAPSKNNQQAGINWAEAYEFGATLSQFGAVAQLGERLRGTQEVGGSSPPGSTPLQLFARRPADAGLSAARSPARRRSSGRSRPAPPAASTEREPRLAPIRHGRIASTIRSTCRSASRKTPALGSPKASVFRPRGRSRSPGDPPWA